MSGLDDEASSGDQKPLARLAVFEMRDGRKAVLARLTIQSPEGADWSVQCAAESEDTVAKIRPIIQLYREARLSSAGDDSIAPAPDIQELAALLEREGFLVEILPASDYQISMEIDFATGRVVGSQLAMHSLADPDVDTGRRILQSLADNFSSSCEALTAELEGHLDTGDTAAAVSAVRRDTERGLFSVSGTLPLLTALTRIEVSALLAEDRRMIRETRMAVAYRLARFDVAGAEADAVLAESRDALDPRLVVALKMTVALGALRRGNRETGLAKLRELLREPDKLTAEERGWAWRNISLTLHEGEAQATQAARWSADAFLEAGNRTDAAKSLLRLAHLLLHDEPSAAVAALDSMIALVDRDGLLGRNVRAAALHTRANQLARLNKHSEAYRDACEAVALRRGLLGTDDAFVSSLHLAAVEARHVGNEAAAKAFETEADSFTDVQRIPHFLLARRVGALARKFDAVEAASLLRDAEAERNLEIAAAVRVLQAMEDPDLADSARLEMLESMLAKIEEAKGPKPMKEPVRQAIAHLLAKSGEASRAAIWYRAILAEDPYDTQALNGLIDCLWKLEQWGDAAIFIRKQLRLRGPLPGLTVALGRSLLEAGDLLGAAGVLTEGIGLAEGNEGLLTAARDTREQALQLLQQGGAVMPAALPAPPLGPVSRDELEAAIDQFAKFVAAEKRKRFWRRDGDSHKWIARPESLAQDLLHTFLKARFDERIEFYEELGTGAGRLDLYARLEGGLSLVFELKMCGLGYSSPYAAAGEGQIKHYMDNRRTALGYLVVFDARIDGFSQPLLTDTMGRHTIIEKHVDVRSLVSAS